MTNPDPSDLPPPAAAPGGATPEELHKVAQDMRETVETLGGAALESVLARVIARQQLELERATREVRGLGGD